MNMDLSAPGVSVCEDATQTLSVSTGVTAVPIFIAKFKLNKKLRSPVRVGSWLEYTQIQDELSTTSAAVTLKMEGEQQILSPKTEVPSAEHPLEENGRQKKTPAEPADLSASEQAERKLGKVLRHDKQRREKADKKINYTVVSVEISPPPDCASAALKLYFQNGGGPCYIYALPDGSNPDLLHDEIREIAEITIIACPENDSHYRESVYSSLTSLINSGSGCFLLADHSQGTVVNEHLRGSAHTAVYYPELRAEIQTARPQDDNIVVKGYQDNVSAFPEATLASVKAINPRLAAVIEQRLIEAVSAEIRVQPSALLAAVYCKTDRERGVWKTPANVVLTGIRGVVDLVAAKQQGDLNNAGINVIRSFSNRGIVVWGGRTQSDDDRWRSIAVRRLFDATERDIKKALRPIVFEANSQPTWKRVRAALDNYLHTLWSKGALAGDKPEDAWFVKVGEGATMTRHDVQAGRMNIQVGLAAVYPAEFIVLNFTQNMSG